MDVSNTNLNNKGNIILAQLNPMPGCIEENALKVMLYIKDAQTQGVDLVVFPELTLMGYPIMDAIDRHPVIVEENVKWLKEIAKLTEETHAIVGFVEPRNGEVVGKRYFNSVAVLGEGKIKAVVRKSLLPTFSEFNDYRYFEPSPAVGCQPAEDLGNFGDDKIKTNNGLIEINGLKYAIVICEDGWNDKDFFTNPLYKTDPVEILAKQNPDVIVNCSASPIRSRKEQLKHNLLSFVAKKYSTPVIYVNQVGAIDDMSYDGSSRVYNAKGELIARAKSFEEDALFANVFSGGRIEPLTKGLEKTLTEQKVFSLDYEPDLERTYKTIIQGIRDYFKKNGLKRAVLGLSGGLDSSVSAVLLADALGAENVFGISMPSVISSQESHDDAKELAENLRINFAVAPIKEMVNTINEQLNPLFDKVSKDWGECRFDQSYVQDNVQARSRATLLWGIANEFCATIPIATSDKSELYMGYATINGDMSGGFAPIADVPKTKLFALARWLNECAKCKVQSAKGDEVNGKWKMVNGKCHYEEGVNDLTSAKERSCHCEESCLQDDAAIQKKTDEVIQEENLSPIHLFTYSPQESLSANLIPEAIILKPPGAELAINPETGETLKAEEALMPYEFLDEIIWRIENKHESYQDMVDSTFLYETKNEITREKKKEWLDKFYKRMSTALYKWSILPPSVIVEGRSINKSDYRQPITSGKIDYKGQSEEEISRKLKELF
jgi:NAD+ synthase (glutamine-hydrolysing)